MLPKMSIGRSLRPIVEGKKVEDWRQYVVGESFLGIGQIGIRDRKYKSIHYGDGPIKVYDILEDPLEMKDLSGEASGKTVIERHRKHLREFVGKLELCRPAEKALASKGGKAYKTYLDWYKKVGEEA